MTHREHLNALADRCEAASGPDRELDAEIAIVIGKPQPNGFSMQYDGERWRAYTASIDTAMTLRSTGWDFGIADFGEDGCEAHVWQHGWRDDTKVCNERTCATPALALAAASLRARAAIVGEG